MEEQVARARAEAYEQGLAEGQRRAEAMHEESRPETVELGVQTMEVSVMRREEQQQAPTPAIEPLQIEEEREVPEAAPPTELVVKSKAPVAPLGAEMHYERSFEALSQQEKHEAKEDEEDKDLVDFFQVKYLESQEVESNYQQSNVDDSMQ